MSDKDTTEKKSPLIRQLICLIVAGLLLAGVLLYRTKRPMTPEEIGKVVSAELDSISALADIMEKASKEKDVDAHAQAILDAANKWGSLSRKRRSLPKEIVTAEQKKLVEKSHNIHERLNHLQVNMLMLPNGRGLMQQMKQVLDSYMDSPPKDPKAEQKPGPKENATPSPKPTPEASTEEKK